MSNPESKEEQEKAKDKKIKDNSLLEGILRLLGSLSKGKKITELEKEVDDLEKQIEGVEENERVVIKKLLETKKEELARRRLEIEKRGQQIREGLASENENERRKAYQELRDLIRKVGREEVEEVVGKNVVDNLQLDESDDKRVDWQKIENIGWQQELSEEQRGKLKGKVEAVGESEEKFEARVGEVIRRIEMGSVEGRLQNVREQLEEAVKRIEEKPFLTPEDVKDLPEELKEQLQLLIREEGEEGSVLERIIEAWDELGPKEQVAAISYLDVLERRMQEKRRIVAGKVAEKMEEKGIELSEDIGRELTDDEKKVRVKGVEISLKDTRRERLKQLIETVDAVGVENFDDHEGRGLVKTVLKVEGDGAIGVWEQIRDELEKVNKVKRVVESSRRKVETAIRRAKGIGRMVDVSEGLPFDEGWWRELSDVEREEWLQKWASLSPGERKKFVDMYRAIHQEGMFPEKAINNPDEWLESAINMDREGYARFSRGYRSSIERWSEEDKERRVKELMEQIMNTGDLSRSDSNREAIWELYSLLGVLENKDLKNEVVAKLLWYDVSLALKGVGSFEDVVRIGSWTWLEVYDDLLNMEIDFGEVGVEELEGKMSVRELVIELESEPRGSWEVWLGRILGAKTAKQVDLEKRRFMLALAMEKMGYKYEFDNNGRIIFEDEAQEALERLLPKFGLTAGGNELINALPRTGKRGEEDVFGEAKIGLDWVIEAAIAHEHMTLRSVALEGGREWRLMINDLRKTHGYGQFEYMRKVDPRFAMFAEIFDLQYRSMIAWKFGGMLNEYREKLEEAGWERKKINRFVGFLKKVFLTDEVSPELRTRKAMMRMMDDANFKEKMKRVLGGDFSGEDWEKALRAMGIEVGGDIGSFEEGWELFKERGHWVRVVSFGGSMKHSDKADYFKYASASRSAFGKIDIVLGDGVTPGRITEAVKIIIGDIGLGNEVGREWGRRGGEIYVMQAGGGVRMGEWVYEKNDGKRGLEQWRWKDEEGNVLEDEKRRAQSLGLELGDDGYVYDERGNRAFRRVRRLVGRTEFGEWGMAGVDWWARKRMIEQWNRDGVLDGKATTLAKTWYRAALWTGIEMERWPRQWREIPTLLMKGLGRNPLVLMGLPYYLLRGFYYDILMSDTFDEVQAAMQPLLAWVNENVK